MNEALADLVRRGMIPDRFLTALFAPPARRDALLALYAFNHELARAREVASRAAAGADPPAMVARGGGGRSAAPRGGDAARRAAIDDGALARDDLLAMIDAREIEAEPAIADAGGVAAYVSRRCGGVAVAAGTRAGRAGAGGAAAVRRRVWRGRAGARRARRWRRRGRCLLPDDLLREHGLSLEAAIATPDAPPVRDALQALAQEGRALLAQADRRRVPRHAIAAALPAVLARRDLARWQQPPAPRGLGDRLAVMFAALRPG